MPIPSLAVAAPYLMGNEAEAEDMLRRARAVLLMLIPSNSRLLRDLDAEELDELVPYDAR
jgi:hypothetical protein